ncbi:Aspergillopepsin [Lachnellula subtilissima]|uniref:Aspergillopepsin n=1 Tax=Lachnellula subtilissima TaxID=602034 RepID=A0A8H8RVL3_9HELO|nr:Aspergillopepsin [Lachnellula subtilissima]
MKFAAVVSTLLLAGSALAAPNTAKRQEAHRRRAAGKTSRPVQYVRDANGNIETGMNSNDTFVSYSTNWAGAVLIGTGYTSVTGTFTVPTPSTAGSGASWVGIDGDTCSTAILQTGIDWTKSGSSVTYDVWYEWYPDYSYDFSDISISAGDTIKATVTATSKTGGTAKVENVTTGKTVTHSFSGESSEGDLCEYNAEWIVEAYEENGSQVSLANFGTETFSSASAVKSGTSVGPSGATIIDMRNSAGSTVVTCTDTSSSVKCVYV